MSVIKIKSHISVVMSLLLLAVCLLPGPVAQAGQDDSLAVINGRHYSRQDFNHWWSYWRDEEEQKIPARPDKFVEWFLQVQEAERMELDTMPEVKRQLDVFRRARSLMMLKDDEVDSKINITDDEINAAYKRDYSPSRLLAVLDFDDETKAQEAAAKFNTDRPDLETVKSMAAADGAEFKLQHPQWLRPLTTPPHWLDLLRDRTAGSFIGPVRGGGKFMLLYLVAVKPGSEADLAHKRKRIHDDIYGKYQQKLTEKFLIRLKKIYNVRVNRELLAKINLSAPAKENWDKILVSSDVSQVTVGYFIEQCRKEEKMMQKSSTRGKKIQASLKRRAMSAMISNSLVDWAANDRHYERQPPLKWEYQFYRQGRLIKLLQRRVIGDVAVSDDETTAYYNDNPSLFRSADIVTISLVHGSNEQINRLWASGMASGELAKSAAKLKLKPDISISQVPLQHLSAAVQAVVKELTKNDISSPFADDRGGGDDGEQMALVQLHNRQPGHLIPLTKVRKHIKDKLRKEKREKLLRNFMAELSKKSTITINDTVWQDIKKGTLPPEH